MSVLQTLTRPLRWRSARRTAEHLMAFARAERSSHYDLMAAAEASPDASRRAQYLAHAIDEARHANIFMLRAGELSPGVASNPRSAYADYEGLYERLGEARFVAFVHHGELRGLSRLRAFRDEHARRGDHKTRALLDAILRDEARHAAYTGELLRSLVPSSHQRVLLRVRIWELYRAWLRNGNTLSHGLFVLSMRGLYFLLFPLSLWLRWREQSRARSSWR